MKTNAYQAVGVGDLVVAVFDEAERYSADPREVSRIATRTITHMLRRYGPKRGEKTARETLPVPAAAGKQREASLPYRSGS